MFKHNLRCGTKSIKIDQSKKPFPKSHSLKTFCSGATPFCVKSTFLNAQNCWVVM